MARTLMNRANSFLRTSEFLAEPRNLVAVFTAEFFRRIHLFSAEYHGILRFSFEQLRDFWFDGDG